jgi:hypothetical protein
MLSNQNLKKLFDVQDFFSNKVKAVNIIVNVCQDYKVCKIFLWLNQHKKKGFLRFKK